MSNLLKILLMKMNTDSLLSKDFSVKQITNGYDNNSSSNVDESNDLTTTKPKKEIFYSQNWENVFRSILINGCSLDFT